MILVYDDGIIDLESIIKNSGFVEFSIKDAVREGVCDKDEEGRYWFYLDIPTSFYVNGSSRSICICKVDSMFVAKGLKDAINKALVKDERSFKVSDYLSSFEGADIY